jgi:hypothetical protein
VFEGSEMFFFFLIFYKGNSDDEKFHVKKELKSVFPVNSPVVNKF